MKKSVISFSILVALASCSKSEIETPQTSVIPDLTAPIVLSAGIEANTETKAAIDGAVFPVNTTDVFRLTAYAGTAAPSNWETPYFNDQQVNSGASSLIAFNTKQYYPADGTQELYFYAYAPSSMTQAAGTTSAAPIASCTLTGQEDIMAAQYTTGIAKVSSGTQSQPTLNFAHKLKQVKFIVKKDASFEAGIKVTSIKVKNQYTAAQLNIETGVLAFGSTTADLTAYDNSTGIEIITDGTSIPGSIMFQPGVSFNLDVVAGGITYSDIVVTLTGTNAGNASVSHTVTLTFKRSEVVPTASIGTWTTGTGNSTDVL